MRLPSHLAERFMFLWQSRSYHLKGSSEYIEVYDGIISLIPTTDFAGGLALID